MLNQATLARPYARAAFEFARAQADGLADWSGALTRASAIMHDEQAGRLVRNPRIDRGQVLELFTSVGGDAAGEGFRNFLATLMHYARLDLLPEIAAQFEVLRSESEQRLKVQVTSAIELDDEQQARLRERLKGRFGRAIDLENHVDPDLVGGVVIQAGDQVIDGSVRGRLERLAQQFTD